MATETALEKPASNEVTRTEHTRSGAHYRPSVNILENAQELLVWADMPGVRNDDIDIRFENGTLTIHGRVEPRRPEGTRYVLQEYGVGGYYRTFEVSEAIDSERITAEYRDGVLTLHLPKVEAVKPRRIAVKTS